MNERGNPNKIIFKYCSTKTAIKILKNSSFQASVPSAFNDPFESMVYDREKDLHFDISFSEAHEFYVLCLSKTPSEILMWSHYAENHKGVVDPSPC